ncbi:MAG: 5'/3'-nucleotidase SurE [Acidobacteriota bacterium]|nr:5'/3'-nucleotidase SurE [Acidobacteriota bacterium]
MRKQILVTNDDGVRSPGILALADALKPLGDVTIVAPLNEASAIGHALTLRRPLNVEKFGERIFSVDGTPTDCVNIAVTKVLDRMPDLVVSGINMGWNIGDDVTYSGTVSGALEGALLGVPSIAVSLKFTRETFDFGPSASAAALYAAAVLEHGLPPRTLLNINVPPGPIRGYRVTVQGKRNHITSVMDVIDPRQRVWYWIEEGQNDWEPHDQSDYQAVKDGFVSVTPLHPDLTNHAALEAVESLRIGTEVEVK